jgi:hypothetical protein
VDDDRSRLLTDELKRALEGKRAVEAQWRDAEEALLKTTDELTRLKKRLLRLTSERSHVGEPSAPSQGRQMAEDSRVTSPTPQLSSTKRLNTECQKCVSLRDKTPGIVESFIDAFL